MSQTTEKGTGSKTIISLHESSKSELSSVAFGPVEVIWVRSIHFLEPNYRFFWSGRVNSFTLSVDMFAPAAVAVFHKKLHPQCVLFALLFFSVQIPFQYDDPIEALRMLLRMIFLAKQVTAGINIFLQTPPLLFRPNFW